MASADLLSTSRLPAKCVICLDDFVEPRRLACSETHVFCTKCLHHHIRTSTKDGQFRCPARDPVCDAMHTAPGDGISGLRNQFELVTDVEQPQAKCTLCADEFVEPRALECSSGATHVFFAKCLYYHICENTDEDHFCCPECESAHMVPENGIGGVRQTFPLATQISRLTQQAPTTERDESVTVFCPEKGHRDKEVVLFCRDHNQLVCVLCVTSQHVLCELSQFTEEINVQRAKINDMIQGMKLYLGDLEKLIETTNAAFACSDNDIQTLRNTIEENFQHIQCLLLNEKNIFMHRVDDIEKQRNQKQVTASQNEHQRNVKDMMSNMERIQGENNLSKLLFCLVQAQKDWKVLQEKSVSALDWELSNSETQMPSGELLGKISVGAATYNTAGGKKESLPKLMDIDMTYHKYSVSGIVELDDAILVTHTENENIYVYSLSDGKQVCQISVPGMKNPWGGLVCTERKFRKFVISDRTEKCFHHIILDKEWHISHHEIEQLTCSPCGLTVDSVVDCQEIVMIDSELTIHTYTKGGTEKEQIELTRDKFTRPLYAAKVKGEFVIADNKANCISWVNPSGTILKSHSNCGGMKFVYPVKLCTSTDDEKVLVVDVKGHAVHMFVDKGQDRTLLTKQNGIVSPRFAHIGPSGRLYVAGKSPTDEKKWQIKVFLFKPQSPLRCATSTTFVSIDATLSKWV